jgi:hypothetical protein
MVAVKIRWPNRKKIVFEITAGAGRWYNWSTARNGTKGLHC